MEFNDATAVGTEVTGSTPASAASAGPAGSAAAGSEEPISVSVQMIGSDTSVFSVETLASATAAEFGESIRSRSGAGAGTLRVMFAGKTLADDRTLHEQGVRRESRVLVALGAPAAAAALPEGTVPVTVTLLSGGRHVVPTQGAGTTVAELKVLVERASGMPASRQRLVFGGTQLEDGRTVGSYGIGTKHTVHCVEAPAAAE